jgi:CspA family cold shock protein
MPCVVHFDLPADHTDYMHRSGRTGRAGKAGVVVSLVTDEEVSASRTLQRSLGFETVVHARDAAKTSGPAKNGTTPKSMSVPVPEDRARAADRRGSETPRGKMRGRGAATPAVSRISRPRPNRHRGTRRSGTPVGTVRFFDAKRGYGFLSRPGGAGDVFVHASSIQGVGPPVLWPGQQVQFEMTTGRKGDEACNVMVI